MNQAMVRYKVKPDQAAHNEDLVRAVYEELHRTAPEGLRYATFVLEDGVSFVHIAIQEDRHNPLPDIAAFRAFTENIADRCEEPPQAVGWREVGSYGFWAPASELAGSR